MGGKLKSIFVMHFVADVTIIVKVEADTVCML